MSKPTWPDWVKIVKQNAREKENESERKELLQLYEVFQTRQIADLDMLHRYANYYVALLMALIAALILGLKEMHEYPVAGLFTILLVLPFVLSQQAKLMAFRFYRRYNEGRARLTKIEYLLGMHGQMKHADSPNPDYTLWEHDEAFVLDRYHDEIKKSSAQYSSDFIHRRSRVRRYWKRSETKEEARAIGREVPYSARRTVTRTLSILWSLFTRWVRFFCKRGKHHTTGNSTPAYGIGYIIQTTFAVFSALFVIAVIALPIGLWFVPDTSWHVQRLNVVYALFALTLMCCYMDWYARTLSQMEGETPEPGRKANSSPSAHAETA